MRAFKGWWVLLILFVAVNIWLLWPKSPPGTRVPYSAFRAQARDGNVAYVRIVGERVQGEFREPVPTNQLRRSAGVPPVASAGVTTFWTVFPEVPGDSGLLSVLEAQNVVVEVDPTPSPWPTLLLINALPIGLIIWSLLRSSGQGVERSQGKIMSFARSNARRQAGTRPRVTFADVAGADEAKTELLEVADFLRYPRRYHEVGARIPRGVLLVGPPGTGKTLMARAVSGEAGVPFFNINASEFVEIFVGVGASRVRDLFEQAKQAAPSIIFIDELDAVGRRREAGLGNVSHEREQTLNQLLVEMDGFDDRHEVIVMSATNRPDVLDPALLRPGRFDRQITVGLPDRAGREAILRVHTAHLQLAGDVDLEALSRSTTGFSGADLANLCNEAALIAVRYGHTTVGSEDFDRAVDKILLGGQRPLMLSDRDRRIVAYHESGHALVAWLTPAADPVHKVTIIPHGRALGATQQLPSEDQYNYTRSYLMARLDVMLGGRAAEETALGEITTGAEQDLVQASRLVRRMVTQWGMGDLGLAAFEGSEDPAFLGYDMGPGRGISEATSARIDSNVQNVLDERFRAVSELLIAARDKLDRVAQALLDEETVSYEQMVQLIGPPAWSSEALPEQARER